MKYLGLFFLIFLSGCKTNQLKNNLREGVWIEEIPLDSQYLFKSKGKYHKGEPVKTWKYYKNGKLEKKEKYQKNICYTIFYHENGEKQSEGKTKFVITEKEAHWFYFDNWHFYDEEGKLIRIVAYENGEQVSEEIIN